jgi:hypothetical protein
MIFITTIITSLHYYILEQNHVYSPINRILHAAYSDHKHIRFREQRSDIAK